MVRNKEHPFPAPGDIVPSSHTGKIERETEEQKAAHAGANHGNVRSPDLQAGEYSSIQHDVCLYRGKVALRPPLRHIQSQLTKAL
jgi:hypothetical protein